MAKYRFDVAISYRIESTSLVIIDTPWRYRTLARLVDARLLFRIPGGYRLWQWVTEYCAKHDNDFHIPWTLELSEAFKEWAGWDDFEDDE